ncbi:asparagine synthase C-terminal domain-containing protein [Candidatus Woesearchaeota archaeon]|nr:asparagine synthase C-terminal domain-containing protein [Candidatus Woesearchaeota archaeon]
MNQKGWEQHVRQLQKRTKEISDKKKLIAHIARAVTDAACRLVPSRKFGVLFSGGLDSSTLALLINRKTSNFFCYAVGFQDGTKLPDDIREAKRAARMLGVRLRCKIYSLAEIQPIIERTIRILGKHADAVNVGVGAVAVAAAQLAKQDKVNTFFTGLGSEEIFAGYERHKVKDVNAECWQGLQKMWQRDIVRGKLIADALNIQFLDPLLDDAVIAAAMQAPGKYKIANGQNKVIFREAAMHLGLPPEIALRKKQAAQYGSCFAKALGKLAKRHGLPYQREYIGHVLRQDS